MFATNPFSVLAETVPSIVMQGFVVLMVLLIVGGTLLDIIHKKNVKYFFENAKKQKKMLPKNCRLVKELHLFEKQLHTTSGLHQN